MRQRRERRPALGMHLSFSQFTSIISVSNDHSQLGFDKQNEQRQRRRDEAAEGTTWELTHFVNLDDYPLCKSFFFSIAACLMSRSQTNVWASCSRQCRRTRTCTSIRTTLLRLKAHELGRSYLAWTAVPFNPSFLRLLICLWRVVENSTLYLGIHPRCIYGLGNSHCLVNN